MFASSRTLKSMDSYPISLLWSLTFLFFHYSSISQFQNLLKIAKQRTKRKPYHSTVRIVIIPLTKNAVNNITKNSNIVQPLDDYIYNLTYITQVLSFFGNYPHILPWFRITSICNLISFLPSIGSLKVTQ